MRHAIRIQQTLDFATDLLWFGKQHCRIQVALQGHPLADTSPRLGQIDSPVEADGIGADIGNLFQPQTAALGKYNRRNRHTVFFALQLGNHLAHIVQRKFLVSAIRQRPAPRIENHHGLCTGVDLGVQVSRHCRRIGAEHVMHQVRTVVQHRLDGMELARAFAFDHVASQGPRAAGKANQRHAAIELGTDLRDRLENIVQLAQIRGLQRHHVFFITQRPLELGAFAIGEIQAQSHGVRHGQDVGKQNRGIQRETVKRLQRDFGGVIGIGRQTHERTGATAGFAILRQIAAGLAHQPQRRVFSWLAQQCAQEGVVLERGELGHERQSECV